MRSALPACSASSACCGVRIRPTARVLTPASLRTRSAKGIWNPGTRGTSVFVAAVAEPAHGVGIGGGHRLEVAGLEGARRDPAFAEARFRRRNRRPGLVAAVAILLRERAVAVPGASHARLASGVRELDPRYGALAFDKLGYSRKTRDVRILPDAGIAVRDASAALD